MSDAPVIMFRPRAWNMLECNMMVRNKNVTTYWLQKKKYTL